MSPELITAIVGATVGGFLASAGWSFATKYRIVFVPRNPPDDPSSDDDSSE